MGDFSKSWDEFLVIEDLEFERSELSGYLENNVLRSVAEYFYEDGYNQGAEDWSDNL